MEPIDRPNIAAYEQEWPKRAFLRRISAPAARSCFSAGRFVRYAPREIMIHEGADDQTVHLLISGCVKVISIQDAQSHGGALLAVRIGGDIVGELSTIDGRRRSASVQVCSWKPAVVCLVDGGEFLRVLEQHPEGHVVLSQVIGSKLRASTRRRIDIADCPPTTRMARLLLELAYDYGQPSPDQRSVMIGISLNQEELGALIGVSKATAHRALRNLRAARLINPSQRPLIIYNVEGLRTAAQLEA